MNLILASAESVAIDAAVSPAVNVDLPVILSHMDSVRAGEVEIDPDVVEQVELIKHLRILYREGAIQLRPADGATDECPTVRVVHVMQVGQDKEERKIHITLRPCETDA